MGRPRIIRKAEDAKDIDPNHSIQVELQPENVVELPEDDGAVPGAAAQKSRAEPATPKSEKEDDNSEVVSLRQQIEDLKKSTDALRRQAEESAAREAEVRKIVEDRDTELKTIGTRAEQAEYDAIINAMGALEADILRAKQELRIAAESQDWGAVAEAQAALAKAGGKLVILEEGKASLEAKAEKSKKEADAPKRVEQFGDPIRAHIDNIPGLLPAQRAWLNEHRELMTDSKKNIRLQNAHIDAEEAGHIAGSEDYFKFLEVRLGYRKEEKRIDMEDDERPPSRPGIVGAPPSRDPPSAGSGRQTSTRITLSPEEIAHARASGITEIEYAKNKLKLIEAKQAGRYGEH